MERHPQIRIWWEQVDHCKPYVYRRANLFHADLAPSADVDVKKRPTNAAQTAMPYHTRVEEQEGGLAVRQDLFHLRTNDCHTLPLQYQVFGNEFAAESTAALVNIDVANGMHSDGARVLIKRQIFARTVYIYMIISETPRYVTHVAVKSESRPLKKRLQPERYTVKPLLREMPLQSLRA